MKGHIARSQLMSTKGQNRTSREAVQDVRYWGVVSTGRRNTLS